MLFLSGNKACEAWEGVKLDSLPIKKCKEIVWVKSEILLLRL